MNDQSRNEILYALNKAEPRIYLIVLPASGTVKRIKARLTCHDLGGEAGLTVFLLTQREKPVLFALDPRALVLDGESLRVVYHPRDHWRQIQEAARQWFRENPGVFVRDVPSGLSYVGMV